MKKKTKRIRRKAVAGILAGSVWVLAAVGFQGCRSLPGKGGEEFTMSDQVEDLTGSYRMAADDPEVLISDSFRERYVDFSLALLQACRKEGGANQMVSPLSVMTALEMTRSGARGETREEMDRTLYGTVRQEEQALDDNEAEELCRELMAYLRRLPSQEEARFHFANSVWFRNGDAGFQPQETFLENCGERYGAGIYGAPFDESTLRDINGWVEKETWGMIPHVLDEISKSAVMYLINGVAFEAQWQEPYQAHQIYDGSFFPQEGEKQLIQMMYSQERRLIRDGQVRGFLKPYREGYAFVALLPEEGMAIDSYLESLSGEKWLMLLEGAENTQVETGLPKFSAETGLLLNRTLEELGMPLAFDVNQADFSGMGRSENGNIFIGKVIHSTFIQVDDQGTRAGATTVVEADAGGAVDEWERVILNRPFLYAIVDTEQGLPIFLGIVDTVGGR